MTRARALAMALTLLGCTAEGTSDAGVDCAFAPPRDTSFEAPRSEDVPPRDSPIGDGEVPCSVPDGTGTCISPGRGWMCCRGVLHEFIDGPCGLRHDAGLPSACWGCDIDPTGPFCPCEHEGGVVCPAYAPRRVCQGGRWIESGFCCPF